MNLREWPLSRIVFLSISWVLVTLLLLAWLLSKMPSVAEAELSGGVGAFSIGLFESATLLLGPPLLLWFFWLILRSGATGDGR
jgi:hypothetical protein